MNPPDDDEVEFPPYEDLYYYEDEPALTRTEKAAVVATGVKTTIMLLVDLALTAFAIWNLVLGRWVFGLGLLIIGIPIASLLVDLATGVLVAPFVGAAYWQERRRFRR